MRRFSLFLIVAMMLVSYWGNSCKAVDADFYVSPDGSDKNQGTIKKPFATISKARDVVREITRDGLKKDVTVLIRGGTYQLKETLTFWQEDSGSPEHSITYAAYPGEKPIISGGKTITGWQEDSDGRWKAKTDIDNFRQLYVNGTRAVRAQAGRIYELELYGDDGYKTKSVELASWKNQSDIELAYINAWAHTRCKVESITKEGDYAIIKMKQPEYGLGRIKEGKSIDKKDWSGDGKYDTIENAFELLDEPGQWYLDRSKDTLYYIPRPGEDMKTAEVIAPVLEKIVELKGTLDRPVHDLNFVGLTFMHASWLRPSKIGLIDIQSNFVVENDNSFVRDGSLNMIHNESIKSPSNIVCHAAKSIRFENCTFTKFGGGGIDLEHGSQDNTIIGCHFYDISATAIQVGDVRREDHHPRDKRLIVKNNKILNNLIENCGVEFKGSHAIFAGYTDGTLIAHNEIRNLPYSAIAVGWGWGEEDIGGDPRWPQPFSYKTPTPAKNNIIEYNHIHNVMAELMDGGAIYTLSRQPNSAIRGNYIHDNKGVPGGIYLDAATGYFDVTQNIVYNAGVRETWGNKPLAVNPVSIEMCRIYDNFFNMIPGDVDIKGRFGKAYFCNFFDIEHSPELEPTEMTIGAWIKPTHIGSGENTRKWIISKNKNEMTQSYYGLGIDADKVFVSLNIDGPNEVISEAGLIKAKQWSYLTMTYDGSQLKIYCDAALVGSKTIGKPRIKGDTKMRIGGRVGTISESPYRSHKHDFEGLVDELSFYNRALTAEQIKANYEAKAKSEMVKEGLVRYWDFEDNKQLEMFNEVAKKTGLEPAWQHLLKH